MSHPVCPWWVGYILLIPFRKFAHHPQKILNRFVQPGMTVLEAGPGMGYFTLPLARMVEKHGRVISVDVQEKMIDKLRQRAQKAGLLERIDARVCTAKSLLISDIAGEVDFVLAFAMIHEVPDQHNLFREFHEALRPGGLILISEPDGHVTSTAFAETEAVATHKGFEVVERLQIKKSMSVLMKKN